MSKSLDVLFYINELKACFYWLNGKSRLIYIFCITGTKQAEKDLNQSINQQYF